MRSFLFVTLASLVASQNFEAPDFNVTEALVSQGVNVSLLSSLGASTERSSGVACSAACLSLNILYGDSAVEFRNESGYSAFTSSFWSSISREVRPYCIFKPSTPEAISVLVLLSRLSQCPFALKSGGHSAFAGAASIEGGITVSFENLKSIKLSDDKKTVAVQPGNVWEDVLANLSTTGVTVLGGRVGDIGVGGLTTGGGISFLTNEYGFACDNVASFDVITASGTVITASPTDHNDLYWALRGGGNNFGVVVSFNLLTKPLPSDLIWGGTRVFTEDVFPKVVQAFTDLTFNSAQDPKAGSWLVFAEVETKIAVTELWYGAPDGSKSHLIAPFYNITAVSDTTKTRSHAAYVMDNKAVQIFGVRQIYYDLTTKASYEMALQAADTYYNATKSLSAVEGLLPTLVFQHVTHGSLKGATRNGGNAMGWDTDGGPLLLILVACQWKNAADDDKVYQVLSNLMTAIKALSVDLNVQNDWVYMNYASQFQNVIASYGEENKKRLKTIASKYDPTSVFQTLQPGYFKLDRAPLPDARYFSH
ncbi:FAD binding domain-containing protein [Ophiobolus disseminans]|uniref:FAD binding domain-containing protein n=1 Tax=Ophiobolus disseminans TaxID=1469910 RepID=A0A6A6ZNI9_9PLEO|nr:FAD binding domain-containing protein [Ophiobolus disseminans]